MRCVRRCGIRSTPLETKRKSEPLLSAILPSVSSISAKASGSAALASNSAWKWFILLDTLARGDTDSGGVRRVAVTMTGAPTR